MSETSADLVVENLTDNNPIPESTNADTTDASVPVTTKSKTALKKEQRYQRRSETFKVRRAAERAKRKEKDLKARRKLLSSATPDQPYVSRRVERKRDREKLLSALHDGIRLCVDMGFSDIMSPKEIGQLASQICYMYSSNKRFEKPFCMNLTSLQKGTLLHEEVVKRCPGFENYKINVYEEPLEKIFAKEDVIYLSPDSPNILQEINPKKVYVIGGLVDGTPKRQVSLQRAGEIGCETARLPIQEFMTRVTPHGYNTILTLNQVYEILMRFNESNSWEVALKASVPQRKGFKLNSEITNDAENNSSQEKTSEESIPEDVKKEMDVDNVSGKSNEA